VEYSEQDDAKEDLPQAACHKRVTLYSGLSALDV
jgi:hypothetical protein